MDTFFERLKQLREELGLTQNEFSKRLGISRVSLTHYEAGDRTPDIEFLKRLHQETGVSLYYLLGLSDSKDDTLAITQRDTGLSEVALQHFANNPISAKVINHLAEYGSIKSITRCAAILHDDARLLRREPPSEWSENMQMLRDRYFESIDIEMTASLVSALTDSTPNDAADDAFGIQTSELPTAIVMSQLQNLRAIRNAFQMFAMNNDRESEKQAQIYTKLIESITGLPERGEENAQETPES